MFAGENSTNDSNAGLEAFTLLSGLPGIGVRVALDLFVLWIPFKLAAQADRYVGKVTGSHGPMVAKDIRDRFAAILHALEEVLHVVGRVLALVDVLYGVRGKWFVLQAINRVALKLAPTNEEFALGALEKDTVALGRTAHDVNFDVVWETTTNVEVV